LLRLDEPTANLDPDGARAVASDRRVAVRRDATMVMVDIASRTRCPSSIE